MNIYVIFPKRHHCKLQGFSLIELALAILIIGLIVTGVTQSGSIISASKVKSQISQLKNAETAITIFKERYGFLPGDMNTNDKNYPEFSTFANQSYSAQRGNQDNWIASSTSNLNRFEHETVVAWQQLKQAGLFEDAPLNPLITYDDQSTIGAAIPWDEVMPKAKFNLAYIAITYTSSLTGASLRTYDVNKREFLNHLMVTGFVSANWDNTSNISTIMTTNEAYNIDVKIDDGLPESGRIQAITVTSSPFDPPAGNCVSSGQYIALGSNAASCSLYYTLNKNW